MAKSEKSYPKGILPKSPEEAERLIIEEEIVHVHPEIREQEAIKEAPKAEGYPPRGAPGSHLNPAYNNPNREIYDAIVSKERQVYLEEINENIPEIQARVGRIITSGAHGKSLQMGIHFAIYVLLALVKRVLQLEELVKNSATTISADDITDYEPTSKTPKILEYFNTPSDVDGKTDDEIKSIASDVGLHVGNTGIKTLRRKLMEMLIPYMPKGEGIKITSSPEAMERALAKKKERTTE